MLNWVDVHAGDMIYVSGGTVHTLGPGAIIVETQQQSDTTYRLYDYGRPRELHLEAGLAAVKPDAHSGKVRREHLSANMGNRAEQLIAAPYFVVERIEVTRPQEYSTQHASGKDSVQIFTMVDGCVQIESANSSAVEVERGGAAVIPACVGKFHVLPRQSSTLLRAYVPATPYPEPATGIMG